ncbi:SDR family oxidoreductase [Acetobacteraceae bacterium KSS8]|uniref:SDR family oxidoreductase n=1 Tax=Endosaccharibacter trunci TaxID=2812733 RepID=A0ABT1WAZ2_9PROT|nr:SDR family oxidoreductase [Acetobacteraceae bacterium KSS8]
MQSLAPGSHAVVVGSGGGIGGALLRALRADPDIGSVTGMGRRPSQGDLPLDLEDEASIEAAFASLSAPPRLVIVATGLLHDAVLQPEKSVRALDAEAMARAFRINTIGPALVAKHALSLFPREGRSVFAVLGARVGSIGDNRSGGWHSYRASKAALAMLVRTVSIELARGNPNRFCIGLHPGTVDTGLSRPFQRGVAEGRLFTPKFAAERLLAVIDMLDTASNGAVLAWDGTIVPP